MGQNDIIIKSDTMLIDSSGGISIGFDSIFPVNGIIKDDLFGYAGKDGYIRRNSRL